MQGRAAFGGGARNCSSSSVPHALTAKAQPKRVNHAHEPVKLTVMPPTLAYLADIRHSDSAPKPPDKKIKNHSFSSCACRRTVKH
jgi:hypothetical protein